MSSLQPPTSPWRQVSEWLMSQAWKLIHQEKEKKIMSCVGGYWFSPRETKIQHVCDVSHAAQQQTGGLSESWRRPSGKLNVSCCAKLLKNNSSSCCPQRKTEGSGNQRQPCQWGSQCLIIMLSAWDGRITTCLFIVCMLGFCWYCCPPQWFWVCFKLGWIYLPLQLHN